MKNTENIEMNLSPEAQVKQSFVYENDIDLTSVFGDLNRIFFESMSCDIYQRYFLLAHTFAPFITPFTKAKAVVMCQGNAASGKTTAARLAGFLMTGKDIIGSVSHAEAYVMVNREPMMVFDDIGNRNLNEQFLNFLLISATGAECTVRKKGKKDVEGTLNSTVWLTGIEPLSWLELIARTFVIKFDQKYHRQDNALMLDLEEELLEKRGAILSALMQVLAGDVFPTINERQAGWVNYIRNTFPKHSKDHMNEYTAALMCLIDALLPYFPLPEKEADLIAADKSHSAFILEKFIAQQNAISS